MLSAPYFRVSFSLSPPKMKLLELQSQFAASRPLLKLQFSEAKKNPWRICKSWAYGEEDPG
ncbi:hypothetical protein V6Z11_A13G043100 [Gossypium hirsutum]